MTIHIRRRELIITLGSMTVAWPLVAYAQQPAMPVIGFLNSASPGPYAPNVAAFRKGLNEVGYVEGQNVAVEYRWAEGQYDRLPAMAVDLVRQQVAAIAVGGNAAVLAAKAATTTIPILFSTSANPIEIGFVSSLNRPGGNLTGVTNLNVELGPKQLAFLHELVPTTTIITLLVNPTNPNAQTLTRDVQATARTIGLQLHVVHASTERDFDSVFANLRQSRTGGLVIGVDPFFVDRTKQLAALSLRHALPAIGQFREFAAAGGLMTYGGSITDNYRLVGVYTGRVLKGEKPADLPVQQATKVELILNLKTAKALALTIPPTLLARADEVIE